VRERAVLPNVSRAAEARAAAEVNEVRAAAQADSAATAVARAEAGTGSSLKPTAVTRPEPCLPTATRAQLQLPAPKQPVALLPENAGRLAAEVAENVAGKTPATVDRIRNVAQQAYNYAVQNPRVQGLNRMQLGKDAEVQATRWIRRWAERNDVNLGPGGLQFQVRGANSVPDVVYDPARQIFDFKLTPGAVRPSQTQNFATDFPGYNIEYIFGP